MVVSWTIYYILCDKLIDLFGSPFYVGFLLRVITIIGLTIYFGVQRTFKFDFNKRKFPLVVITALTAFAFDCLINVALQYSSASTGTALLKTEMIFVLAINAISGKVKIKLIDLLLVLLMSSGSTMIVLRDFSTFRVDLWSMLFVISALLNSICAFLIKKMQTNLAINSNQIVYINNVVSCIMYFILSFCITRASFVEYSRMLNANSISVLLICGFCQITLMLTYYSALGKYPVWIVKVVLLVIPILTLVWDGIFKGTTFTPLQLIGIVLTIMSAGAMIGRTKANRKKLTYDKLAVTGKKDNLDV